MNRQIGDHRPSLAQTKHRRGADGVIEGVAGLAGADRGTRAADGNQEPTTRSTPPKPRHSGRSASSRQVWVVGQRRGLDHQELARVLLALVRPQAEQLAHTAELEVAAPDCPADEAEAAP